MTPSDAQTSDGGVALPVSELTTQLIGDLGPTLVALLAGVRDRNLPGQWSRPNGPAPSAEITGRLRAAHQMWQQVTERDSPDVARAWFIGLNPLLGDQAPALALAEGRTDEAIAAARAFAHDSWLG
jgi:hypothetical protein